MFGSQIFRGARYTTTPQRMALGMMAVRDSRSGPVNRLEQALKLIGGHQSLIPSETEDFTKLEIDIESPVDSDVGITSHALNLVTSFIPKTYAKAAPLGRYCDDPRVGIKFAYAKENIAKVLEAPETFQGQQERSSNRNQDRNPGRDRAHPHDQVHLRRAV
ncbi:MAG: hypothetical protein Q9181_003381 [Wetmoreana brouardii]